MNHFVIQSPEVLRARFPAMGDSLPKASALVAASQTTPFKMAGTPPRRAGYTGLQLSAVLDRQVTPAPARAAPMLVVTPKLVDRTSAINLGGCSLMDFLPLPALPKFSIYSPQVVQVFDKIRFNIDSRDDCDYLAEFSWFAREYPRCYRYHLECAQYRLESIYHRYVVAHEYFVSKNSQKSDVQSAGGCSTKDVNIIYWDFDSFLSSINSALDLLARIIGPAYKEHTAPSFNKLCKKASDGPVRLLQKAQSVWVRRMKDYRDCFVHYTPVDTINMITTVPSNKGWQIRVKLPVNPNARDILGFRYSKRVELLRYAISTYKHMTALDKGVAKNILHLYKKGDFPKRSTDLFFLGKRS